MSSKTPLLVVFGVVGLAAAAAFFALRGGGDTPEPAPVAKGGAAVAAPDAASEGPAAPAAPARRRRQVPPGTDADKVAVAGVVLSKDGAPVEGARVLCYSVPADEPRDEMRVMKSVLGDLVGDEELEMFGEQLGLPTAGGGGASSAATPRSGRSMRMGFGMGARARAGASVSGGANGQPSDDEAERAARMGMEIGRKMISEPARLTRAMRAIQFLAAGFEDDAALPLIDETTTDAKGAFRFDALTEGARVELRVAAPRMQRHKTRESVGNVKVEIKLDAASVITGEVRSEGHPLGGAAVRFRTQTVTTGADGRFRYVSARAPKEPLLVSAPGHAAAGLYVKVPEKGDAESVVVELLPAGTVRGRVSGRDGGAVRGAQVAVVREGMGMMAMFMPMAQGDKLPAPDPVALTGDDGTFVLDGMPAGKVKLRVSKVGFLDGTAGPLTVLAGETLDGVDFVLAKESALTGRVVDAAGKPVAEAMVGVDSPAEGMMGMAAQFMGGSWKTARTDADGRYRVSGATEGDHKVYVEAAGYLKQNAQATLPPEGALNMDFTLPPGHEIGGTVMRPDGTPVAGATVRISAAANEGANPFAAMLGGGTVGRATSGEDGRFSAKGLPEGPYTITAKAPEFLDAEAANVQPGAMDLMLRLGAAATIRGRVVAAADGTTVGGATVFYKSRSGGSAGGNPMMQMMRGGESQVTAQPDGTYTITGVPGGSYEVWARAAGFADSSKTRVATEGGGTADGVDLSLPPGSSVSGRVVRKGAGTPVEGALVWVSLDRNAGGFGNVIAADFMDVDPVAPANSVSGKTGADGTFTLNGLTPGKIVIEVRAKGLAALSFGGAEAPASNVNCEMSEGGSVAGIAYSKAGVPMENGTVMLQRGMMGQGMAGMATTDRNGRFRIDRVPPASYQVMLIDPEAQIPMPQMKNAAVRDGEVAEVTFGKKGAGRVVTGTVLRGDKPLTQGAVSLIGGSAGMQLATLDQTGAFRFEGVEPGTYTVTAQVQMMGGGNVSGRVTVAEDADPAPVRLEMSVLSISGMVVDAETGKGIGLAQVTLNARDSGGSSSLADLMARQRGQAFTGADGRFTMEGVPQGVFDLRVVASGYAEAEVEGVSAGANAVRVTLDKGLELAVTVLGPDGKPAVGAMVIPADASGREGTFFDMTASKQTGQDGVARLRLQSGRYTLRVRSAAYPEASVSVEASSAAVTVRLEDGGVLEVLAKTAAGQPASGAKVTLLDASGAEIKASLSMGNLFGSGDTTDAAGRAIRDGLRAGKVTVVVKSVAGAETRSSATVSAGEVARVEVVLSE